MTDPVGHGGTSQTRPIVADDDYRHAMMNRRLVVFVGAASRHSAQIT
jgi:hypothetical protein